MFETKEIKFKNTEVTSVYLLAMVNSTMPLGRQIIESIESNLGLPLSNQSIRVMEVNLKRIDKGLF